MGLWWVLRDNVRDSKNWLQECDLSSKVKHYFRCWHRRWSSRPKFRVLSIRESSLAILSGNSFSISMSEAPNISFLNFLSSLGISIQSVCYTKVVCVNEQIESFQRKFHGNFAFIVISYFVWNLNFEKSLSKVVTSYSSFWLF